MDIHAVTHYNTINVPEAVYHVSVGKWICASLVSMKYPWETRCNILSAKPLNTTYSIGIT